MANGVPVRLSEALTKRARAAAEALDRPIATIERGWLVSPMRGKLPRWARAVLRSPHRRR